MVNSIKMTDIYGSVFFSNLFILSHKAQSELLKEDKNRCLDIINNVKSKFKKKRTINFEKISDLLTKKCVINKSLEDRYINNQETEQKVIIFK